MSFPPTTQQVDFLDALINTKSNLALVARAGCGKTSTILLGVDAYAKKFPNAEIIVCAFNKAIADEVKAKLISAGHNDWRRVSAATIHSLGYGLIKFVFKSTIDDNKIWNLVDEKLKMNSIEPAQQELLNQYGPQIVQLVKLGKQAGVGFFPDSPIGDVTVWHAIADHYDINGLEETDQMDAIVEMAQIIYRESLALTAVVDFDDMILFPLIKNLRVKFGKDLIFLDEAQDLSRSRQALARKFIKPGGRMVVVGDDRQAIYGFSGADAAALSNLVSGLNATTLPLSITWRCPKAVVKLAQGYVPDIEAAPTAPEGKVERVTELPGDLTFGDAILCRNTAPLIKIAYSLIRKGKPCKVEGRAIGDGLLKLVGRWKIATIDSLIKRIEEFKEREMQKAMAKGSEAKAEEVADRCDTILEICHACIEKGNTRIDDVKAFINNLFADGATGVIVLATYHRSKGREWKRVILWEHAQRCPSKAAKQPWQRVQEDNLAYVAITRSQSVLVFVN
jgi:superfamily I DNA/RNA helicase